MSRPVGGDMSGFDPKPDWPLFGFEHPDYEDLLAVFAPSGFAARAVACLAFGCGPDALTIHPARDWETITPSAVIAFCGDEDLYAIPTTESVAVRVEWIRDRRHLIPIREMCDGAACGTNAKDVPHRMCGRGRTDATYDSPLPATALRLASHGNYRCGECNYSWTESEPGRATICPSCQIKIAASTPGA